MKIYKQDSTLDSLCRLALAPAPLLVAYPEPLFESPTLTPTPTPTRSIRSWTGVFWSPFSTLYSVSHVCSIPYGVHTGTPSRSRLNISTHHGPAHATAKSPALIITQAGRLAAPLNLHFVLSTNKKRSVRNKSENLARQPSQLLRKELGICPDFASISSTRTTIPEPRDNSSHRMDSLRTECLHPPDRHAPNPPPLVDILERSQGHRITDATNRSFSEIQYDPCLLPGYFSAWYGVLYTEYDSLYVDMLSA